MANGNTPWGDEQEAVDEYGSSPTAVTPQATPGPMQGPGLMTIGADAWRQQQSGPVDLQGQGLRIAGGTPSPPQPLPSWFAEQQAAKEELERRRYIETLMRQAGPVNANQAIEKAMRMEGVLGFEADRKAGMPLMEAMSKHASKMFYNNPSSMLGLARLQEQQKVNAARIAQMTQSQLPSGPVTAQEVRTPEGKVVAHFVPGQGGHKYMLTAKPEEKGLTREQQFRMIQMRLRDIDNEMKAVRESPKTKDQEETLNALRNQRLNLYKEMKKIGYNRIKHNETGKEFYHQGNPTDIPSTYSVLNGDETPAPAATSTEFEQD